jgi:protein-disulfide isomerase
MKSLIAAALLLSASLFAPAQSNAPNAGFPFKNMTSLKPPAGSSVAIFEFEDMECPVCAADAPIVRKAVADYKVPYVRRDFPLTEIHIWSFDAAVTARYIQDKLSPTLAEQFRRDVFANQNRIDNKDDLARFTRTWFASHNQNLPFVMDASGACRAEVKSDRALGDNLNIHATPCVFVVTQNKWVHVDSMSQLYQTIDQAIAESRAPATAPRRRTRAHP